MPVLKIGYAGDFILECHSFMKVPDTLRQSAARLAYNFGMYCMDIYESLKNPRRKHAAPSRVPRVSPQVSRKLNCSAIWARATLLAI